MRHGHENVDVVMNCDVQGCLRQVRRAPRILVPSRTPRIRGHAPLRIMTTLHYCDLHHDSFRMSDYWTSAIRARAELTAKRVRPTDFKLDFEAARVEFLLVTTPEYRAFLQHLGVRRVVA